jgi:anti-sigma factor RsiW
MNCKDFERIAYLYEESEPAEKMQLEQHMATCSECSELFNRLEKERPMIRQLFPGDKPDFPGALTERIVAAVKQQKEQNLFDKIFQGISFSGMRYACASLSLIIVIAFVAESSDNHQGKRAVSGSTGGIELRSASLLENMLTDRKRGESLFATIKKQEPTKGTNSTF